MRALHRIGLGRQHWVLCCSFQAELDRRRPGQSRITTPRKESDTCEIYSGVSEGITLGTPICIMVPNTDQKSQDYSEMSVAYRPSHADATYDMKYGIRAVRASLFSREK
jgi:chorismate synthase